MAKKAKPANKLAGLTNCAPSPVAYRPSKEDRARQRRYEAEDALRSLTRAAEIKTNTQLMRDVRQLAAENMKTLKSVTAKRK